MAGAAHRRPGGLAVFSGGDFEGDWRRVAGGGFGQVFRARHRRWRTEFAIKCGPGLLPDAARYPLPGPWHSIRSAGPRTAQVAAAPPPHPGQAPPAPPGPCRPLPGAARPWAAGGEGWGGGWLRLLALCRPHTHPQTLKAGRAEPGGRLWRLLAR